MLDINTAAAGCVAAFLLLLCLFAPFIWRELSDELADWRYRRRAVSRRRLALSRRLCPDCGAPLSHEGSLPESGPVLFCDPCQRVF